MKRARAICLCVTSLGLSACSGPQNALDAAGFEAAEVLRLFWGMLAGAVAIWVFVVAISYYASRGKSQQHSEKAGLRLIIWGGCVFPTLVLAALLVWGLAMMPQLRGPANGPTIAVSGERFWWRIAYDVEGEPGVVRNLPTGGIPSANELWIPVNRRTEVLLGSPDVIHSFWVPSLAGKMDAIPGRVNRLILEPTELGVFNGACAEFCGTAHAQMGLRVVVVSEQRFAEYVRRQAEPARRTNALGFKLFRQSGCGACHTVRGTQADADVGPDLTHLASRRTLAAGLLPMTKDNIAAFIGSPDHLKPGVEMPSFDVLPTGQIDEIAKWLGSLE